MESIKEINMTCDNCSFGMKVDIESTDKEGNTTYYGTILNCPISKHCSFKKSEDRVKHTITR